MHIVSLPERLELQPGYVIEPGDYISENLLCAQLINLAGDGGMRPMEESRPFDDTKDWNGKKILFMRAGGFGDIVNLTPTLREVKRRWPDAEVHLATMGEYGTVLEGLPYVSSVMKYPVSVETASGFDAWVFFEKAIEGNPRAEKIHMADLFAEITGLKFGLLANKFDGHPDYIISKDEASWATVQYPHRPGIKRLSIQVSATARCRVYPMQNLEQVLNAFKAKKDWEVFLLGEPGKVQAQETENVKNLTMHNVTFRQSAAVVGASDCFLGSDSALVHVAGALGVPAVGLFGPFPWKLRTAYSPSVVGIQGKGKCSPCFFHEKHQGALARDLFPKDCPSRERGYCEVLETIDPKRVVAQVEKIARAPVL